MLYSSVDALPSSVFYHHYYHIPVYFKSNNKTYGGRVFSSVYYGFYKPLMRRSNYIKMVELLYGFVNTSKLLAELKYHLLSTGLTTLIVHFLFHISSSPNQMGSNPALRGDKLPLI